jgi:hypothetical protein
MNSYSRFYAEHGLSALTGKSFNNICQFQTDKTVKSLYFLLKNLEFKPQAKELRTYASVIFLTPEVVQSQRSKVQKTLTLDP